MYVTHEKSCYNFCRHGHGHGHGLLTPLRGAGRAPKVQLTNFASVSLSFPDLPGLALLWLAPPFLLLPSLTETRHLEELTKGTLF